MYGIHQTVALIALTLGGVHAFSQLAVPGGTVRLVDQFIPFLNRENRLGLGVGVVGLEIMTAAAVSILIQRRLGHRRWRALHSLTYPAFLLVVAHVLIAGSDTGPVWVWLPVLLAGAVTVGLWFSTTRWAGPAVLAVRQRVPRRRPGSEITVDVDVRKCVRFGFCEQEAPEIFVLRTDGRLSYRATVATDESEAVFRAVAVCPARAISAGGLPASTAPAKSAGPPEVRPHAESGAVVTGLHRRRGGRR